MRFKIGDLVKLKKLPDNFASFGEELQFIFKQCLGQTFIVTAIEDDLIVLDASSLLDPLMSSYENDIRVLAEEIELVSPAHSGQS